VNGDRVPILIGGMNEKAIERTVTWGSGWTVGGAPPEQGGPFAERVRAAWRDGGRAGAPRIVGLTYFGLSEDAEDRARRYLKDYYGEMGERIAAFIPKDAGALKETVAKFADHGFDELYLDPTTDDLDEVDRAADAVLS
jgi:alkanesulfonate monooxygenase SsuD/methylene tetrahydromethanopterin reductase-like flavin-dependent oxidoreductase (luciferase family)